MLIRNVGQITIVGSLERIITIFLLRIVYSPFSLFLEIVGKIFNGIQEVE